ncbi:hypothetical protein L1887_10814 [Cichorium endivia]|nr:hypothetical protein L1887_10814 [Cichorium endivia]
MGMARSMKGLTRLQSPGNDEEDEEGGSSGSDVEEHLEVERILDHDLSRFEMIYPNYGGADHNSYLLENKVDCREMLTEKILDTFDVVLDVGEYMIREPTGLIIIRKDSMRYLHYGTEIIAKTIQLDEGYPDVQILFAAVYKNFVEE